MIKLETVLNHLPGTSDLKTALADVRISPELMLKQLIEAYAEAQKEYNTAQQELEAPTFINTVVQAIEQPIGTYPTGEIYRDNQYNLRIRTIYAPNCVTDFNNTVRGIL